VRRLDLFGWALDDRFDEENSDIDVLVEFSRTPGLDYVESYFRAQRWAGEDLRPTRRRRQRDRIRNPYFRNEVLRTRELLYAA
jgi:uncharacterized protein